MQQKNSILGKIGVGFSSIWGNFPRFCLFTLKIICFVKTDSQEVRCKDDRKLLRVRYVCIPFRGVGVLLTKADYSS